MAESGFRRIRPFKIAALLMTLVAIILTIVALAGPEWVNVSLYRNKVMSWGLWRECVQYQALELCTSSAWLKACGAMILLAFISSLITMVCAVWGLCAKKRLAYVISGTCCILAIICLIICLIVYPVMFTDEVKNDPSYKVETVDFTFDWTYGVAWSAVFFLIGAAIFFFIRVKEEQDAQPMKSAFGREMPPAFYNSKA